MPGAVVTSVNASQKRGDAEERRSVSFPRWSARVYGGLMPPREGTPRPLSPLMEYLKAIQERPGWSIARVARESGGHISRATLFRLMAGDTKRGATIETVRLVAQIVGDDPDTVLARVAGSLVDDEIHDPRLEGLDPHDEVVQEILSRRDVTETWKAFALQRRRQILELRRQQDLQALEMEIQQMNEQDRPEERPRGAA